MATAMSPARGSTLSERSEDSERKSCMPPTRRNGSTAMLMPMMPMPPRPWVSARHRSSPGGSASSPTITVEPVVVRPETLSNTASVMESRVTPNMKGRAAKALTRIQARLVSRKSWRVLKLRLGVQLVSTRTTPKNSVSVAEAPKTIQSSFPTARSTAMGTNMEIARMFRMKPTT